MVGKLFDGIMGFNVNLHCVTTFVTQINWSWSDMTLFKWLICICKMEPFAVGEQWNGTSNFQCLLHGEIKQ